MTEAAILIQKVRKSWQEAIEESCPRCRLYGTGGVLCFQCRLHEMKAKDDERKAAPKRVLILVPLLMTAQAHAYEPKLEWDLYTDAATKLRIYWQQSPGAAFTIMAEPAVTDTLAQIPSLPENVQHCFYMTAANASTESDPSNTVCYTALPRLKLEPSELAIYGEPGRSYAVFQSPDFVTWERIATVTLTDHVFKLPVSFSELRMFFKVEGLPNSGNGAGPKMLSSNRLSESLPVASR